MDTKIDFKDPAYYENRELSWIKFDQRVLSEARDKSIPLLERLKFVSKGGILKGYGTCKI